jgi:hypothetical protein
VDSRVTAEARAQRFVHRGLVVLAPALALEDDLSEARTQARTSDALASLEVALFDSGVAVAQVGLDLEAAIALSRAGLVALASVPSSGRERAIETVRSAGVLWLDGTPSLEDLRAAIALTATGAANRGAGS